MHGTAMNRVKLRGAEHRFLSRYPGGFQHPEIQAIGKKLSNGTGGAFDKVNIERQRVGN